MATTRTLTVMARMIAAQSLFDPLASRAHVQLIHFRIYRNVVWC